MMQEETDADKESGFRKTWARAGFLRVGTETGMDGTLSGNRARSRDGGHSLQLEAMDLLSVDIPRDRSKLKGKLGE